MPAASARRASARQSGQLADQRSGTQVAVREDEQLAPNTPIFSVLALYMAMRSRIDPVRVSKARSSFRVFRSFDSIPNRQRRCTFTEARAAPASAADLKFLHHLPHARSRNFRSKSGTRIICLLVPLLFPKFVSDHAAMYHELRKRGTSRLALTWQ